MTEDSLESSNGGTAPPELYGFGPFALNPSLRLLYRHAEMIPLTGTQMDMLLVLVRIKYEGKSLRRNELEATLWGREIGGTRLSTHVKNLRNRLGKQENGLEFIETWTGQTGYYLAVEVYLETKEPHPPAASVAPPESAILPDPRIDVGAAPPLPMPDRSRFSAWVTPVFGTTAATVLLAIGLLTSGIFNPDPPPATRFGRLLPRTTSEGRQTKQVPLNHRPKYLAISPRGDRVFATGDHGRSLSIISTRDDSVTTITLPQVAGPLAVSPKGKLYIGSLVEGIMTVDVETGRLLPEVIATGGPVTSLAITADGSNLFLAMSMKGLKRLSLESGKLTQISDRICPQSLEMDRQGKRLYVAYQCSGPEGQRGHDSVEIFDVEDVEKETSIGIVNGLPMVGGQPFASPDGKLVLLDGWDACWAPQYDHRGCQSVPSHVFHLLRTADLQILRTFEFPVHSSPGQFLDNSRFVLGGDSLSVVDAARYNVLERSSKDADCWALPIVFTPDGRNAYVACEQNKLLVLQPESSACSPPLTALAMFYAADGTTEDSAGVAELTSHGNVRFTPGRVGQAFFLDGSSYLSAPWTGSYEFGLQDATLALYVKFAGIEGDMALVDWVDENPRRGIRLLKSARGRLIFQSWPEGSQLESTTSVRPDVWYHLVVTRTGSRMTLYVDGKPESIGIAPPLFDRKLAGPLFLGAQSGMPSFRGLLDEIGFYSRALTAKEVGDMYRLRQSGACKL